MTDKVVLAWYLAIRLNKDQEIPDRKFVLGRQYVRFDRLRSGMMGISWGNKRLVVKIGKRISVVFGVTSFQVNRGSSLLMYICVTWADM